MQIIEMIISLVLQAVLYLAFIGSLITDLVIRAKNSKLGIKVKRGNTSWEYLIISYNILTIFFIAIVSVSIYFNEYRIIIIIVDQIFLVYLCFFSDWFKNKIIGTFSKIKSLEDIHKK